MFRWLAVALASVLLAACFDWDVAPSDAGVGCETLAASAAAARVAAIACEGSDTGACSATVEDPCGCPVRVAHDGSATADYEAAVARFRSAGCACVDAGPCESTMADGCQANGECPP